MLRDLDPVRAIAEAKADGKKRPLYVLLIKVEDRWLVSGQTPMKQHLPPLYSELLDAG